MLPKKYKLKKDKDFKRIFRKGKEYQGNFLKIKLLKNDLQVNRFAIVIGVKISKKAVQRNLIKRRIEETIHANLNNFQNGWDMIILPQREILDKNYQEIKESLMELLKNTKPTILNNK
jgi:ribonuclease P protein component